ncbi:exonuclease SbcD [Paucilactobacillus oligofermentans DSM 15707 = LMG 22743]|uniref:Nuclease SbcCD subunit D n=1 Tax=Paucilactobacillus oligofermentans DSM 15707 = LMG 22743 TaxID=1423778 RepID=A0A0R1RPV8_9LACO|nr:exonuclease SbcCD subunit D [Paucilactobacillus oligofermentans]KRL56021.1 exonuclease SbcD [Paucilactobacillus oligofermentans DSM 15707 = LMG 22743]CUS25997.1 Possible exonuclease SbcD [Paucilactobacillus oligofermentans DSM 15707 = LMG 22743]
MKLLHTADWHIGKELGEYSLLEEQWHAFHQIVKIAVDEKVDGIIIAGDLYDRAIAPTSAVNALESMLRELNLDKNFPIYAVSGNHDGATRLGAGHEWREQTKLFLNTSLAGAFTPIETDEAQIFLLPFLDPLEARTYYQIPEEQAANYSTIEQVMAKIVPDLVAQFIDNKQHLLVTHFNVTGSGNDDYQFTSETNSRVGGLKGVPAALFNDFDYVALGHIHLKQASPNPKMQYAGSPVKFNTKEAQSEKGCFIVNINEDGVTTDWKPIVTGKDLIVLKGSYDELIQPEFYEQYERNGKNWFSITIDGIGAREARATLSNIYGDVVEINYNLPKLTDNTKTKFAIQAKGQAEEDVVGEFYREVTDDELSTKQVKIVEQTLTELRKAEEN